MMMEHSLLEHYLVLLLVLAVEQLLVLFKQVIEMIVDLRLADELVDSLCRIFIIFSDQKYFQLLVVPVSHLRKISPASDLNRSH